MTLVVASVDTEVVEDVVASAVVLNAKVGKVLDGLVSFTPEDVVLGAPDVLGLGVTVVSIISL